jgi:hypothetical protein
MDRRHNSEILMAAVTVGFIAAHFAPAKIDCGTFCGIKLLRCEVSGFMGAIAKRLILALSASAPEIAFAFFNIDCVRRFLSNNWI